MIPKKLCSDSLFDFTLKILIEEKEFLFPCSRISISVSSFFKFVESKSLDSFIKVSDKTTSEDLFNSQSSVKHIEPPTGVKRKSTFMDSWLVPSQNYFACDKCKMRVEVDSFEVHQDYHFALELAKTEK